MGREILKKLQTGTIELAPGIITELMIMPTLESLFVQLEDDNKTLHSQKIRELEQILGPSEALHQLTPLIALSLAITHEQQIPYQVAIDQKSENKINIQGVNDAFQQMYQQVAALLANPNPPFGFMFEPFFSPWNVSIGIPNGLASANTLYLMWLINTMELPIASPPAHQHWIYRPLYNQNTQRLGISVTWLDTPNTENKDKIVRFLPTAQPYFDLAKKLLSSCAQRPMPYQSAVIH